MKFHNTLTQKSEIEISEKIFRRMTRGGYRALNVDAGEVTGSSRATGGRRGHGVAFWAMPSCWTLCRKEDQR